MTAALKSVRLCILGRGNLNRIVSIVYLGGGVGFWEGGGKTCTKQALTNASHQIAPSLQRKLSCRQKKYKKLAAILLAS